jgi:hypothetical protein
MKIRFLLLLILCACFGLNGFSVAAQTPSALHTPAKGSAERQAIMDVLRDDFFKQTNQRVVFQVNHLKVHQGWAWVDVTPLDDKGKAVAEGGPALLHYEKGAWTMVDLTVVADDPDDPLGPMDPSPLYIKNVQKKYPGVPTDIFPARHK